MLAAWKAEKSSMLEEPWPIKEREVWFWLPIIIDKLEPTVIFWPQTQINQLKTACSCTTANQSQAFQDDPLSPTSTMSWLLCSICYSDSRSNTHLILYAPTNQECCSQCQPSLHLLKSPALYKKFRDWVIISFPEARHANLGKTVTSKEEKLLGKLVA